MPVDIPKLSLPDDTNPNPNAGPDETGLHNRSLGTKKLPDESERGEYTSNKDDPNRPKEDPDHTKDKKFEKYNEVEVVGSVSELATLVLNGELKKRTSVPKDLRIIVITDKDDVKGLIPIVAQKDRKLGVYHNRDNHLPLYDRSLEDWLDANDIPYSADMGTLLYLLGAR